MSLIPPTPHVAQNQAANPNVSDIGSSENTSNVTAYPFNISVCNPHKTSHSKDLILIHIINHSYSPPENFP